jgi:AAA+ ATPase superfamily predicted ATPase
MPTKIGGWWRANEEIDLLAPGPTDALLVECKWSNRPVGLDVLENLKRKSQLMADEIAPRKVLFALCSRSGFTPEVSKEAARSQDLLLFDLPQIAGG